MRSRILTAGLLGGAGRAVISVAADMDALEESRADDC
ncbi:hypothetical protein ABH903_000060 [Brevibacterium epidermidis]|jgi:hypothetical protein|uniref:Uncharacterized protein n=1 Tax=Brevibacterium epidermidis TaxID=1698 RepID=A0ABV4EEW8_BREEP